jgi:hypothetical protein
MNEDALDREKAAVLLDYQKTENEIAGLESQAQRMGEAIATFGNWLRTNAVLKIYRQDQAHHRHYEAEFVPNGVMTAMRDWQQAFDLADKLREANLKLASLKTNKQKLGLR